MLNSTNIIEAEFIKPQIHPVGPANAEIMVVGEAPGEHEVAQGIPFVGMSGKELDRMLHDAGILRSECFITNVARVRPPANKIDSFYLTKTDKSRTPGPVLAAGIEMLKHEIAAVRPKVIIGLGDTALWALTGKTGITKWRGSQLSLTVGGHDCCFIPTYHPAAIMRMWSWRFAAVIDLKRARRTRTSGFQIPQYSFSIRPSFEDTTERLQNLPPGRHSLDLETRGGHIACLGVGSSSLDAFCIPFMCVERDDGYWLLEEERAIIHQIRKLFADSRYEWVLQNGLYDCQYFARYWGTIPQVALDTMIAQHVLMPGMPKGLDFLSSLYCKFHQYWKDEGKEWNPRLHSEDDLWQYNCKDCVTTWETAGAILPLIESAGLTEQLAFKMREFPAALRMMLRGVRCNKKTKNELIMQLTAAKAKRQEYINVAVGRPLSVASPKQMKELFYDELGLPVIKHKKTRRPTTDKDAIAEFRKRRPILIPLLNRIQDLRSINTYLSTFALMALDRDDRIRCSCNTAGTETFRWSTSKNAFGSGNNLQNIPSGKEDEDEALPHDLPNIKRFFIPDEGFEICDADLQKADAQVVAWEAHDDELKEIFRGGYNLHLENAKAIYSNERLTSDSPEYKLAKAGVHATNYGSSARTLARALGITVHQAEMFQRRWFAAHPGIRRWHNEVANSLATTRGVRNKFGFRRIYFDRIENLLPEALAWIPQSTVAIVICKGLVALDEQHEFDIRPLLQVHDSLVFEYPRHLRNPCLRKAQELMRIPVPYDDPLTIDIDFKVSAVSWGDCEKVQIVDNYTS